MSAESQHIYVLTPQEFLDRNLSMGELGDIRETPMEIAVEEMARIARDRQLGRAGIALLAFRQDDMPENVPLAPEGLVYPLYPCAEQNAYWQGFRDDCIRFGVPGMLHAYNRDGIQLPI